jgi:hypothetical protein
MSARWSFLSNVASRAHLPIRTVFTHQLENAPAEVALQYWPRKDGSSDRPSQLTLFILGASGPSLSRSATERGNR